MKTIGVLKWPKLRWQGLTWKYQMCNVHICTASIIALKLIMAPSPLGHGNLMSSSLVCFVVGFLCWKHSAQRERIRDFFGNRYSWNLFNLVLKAYMRINNRRFFSFVAILL